MKIIQTQLSRCCSLLLQNGIKNKTKKKKFRVYFFVSRARENKNIYICDEIDDQIRKEKLSIILIHCRMTGSHAVKCKRIEEKFFKNFNQKKFLCFFLLFKF